MTLLLLLSACASPTVQGPAGMDGADGDDGDDGIDGIDGIDGVGTCVSVLDFGGVGDGVADDTAAIQAAIDSLPTWSSADTGSGGAVCLPAGTWRVTTTVQVPDYVTVRGEGMWATLVVPDPASEPLSVFARKGSNAQKNLRFADLGVVVREEGSVAFDLSFITRAILQRVLVTNPDYTAGAAAGTGVYMEAGDGLSGYDNRVLESEMYGLATGVDIGTGAHAAVIERNTITNGQWAVRIAAGAEDPATATRITHNRFEAMDAAFVLAGGQDALIDGNWMEAYASDTLTAAIELPAGSRWNVVGTNYVALSSTPALEVLDEGEYNGWGSYYTRVVESRVSGDNLEQRVVRVGDGLPRGLSIVGSYVKLGSSVRVTSRLATLVDGDTLDPSAAAHVHVSGPASSVTIGTTGTDVGTVLLITGDGDEVELVDGSTADLAGGSITLGSGAGRYTGITLIYAGNGKWMEVGRSGER
jgi:hypothetical protein